MTRHQEAFLRVAALYDLHGNALALEAVLAEIADIGVDAILIGGDIAWGPQPRAVVERVMSLPGQVLTLRGNADREVADPATVAGDIWLRETTEWCAAQLTDAQRAWLGSLPAMQTFRVAGLGDVLACHGSPRSDVERIAPDVDDAAVHRMVATVEEPTVIVGHTHVAFDRRVGAHRIVNAGSVGLHYGASTAQWALLGPDIVLRQTGYDREQAAVAAVSSGIPGGDEFATWLRNPLGG